jgi:hypothetical protein
MENFDEKYNKYIEKLKNDIPYALWEKRLDLEFNFNYDVVFDNSLSWILWFVCGIVGSLATEHNMLPRIFFVVAWLSVGILCLILNAKQKKQVLDYVFRKYEYHKIIEDHIKRDKQRDIDNLLEEMFKKEKISIDDLETYLEVYEFKLKDIEFFYNQCLSKIKYEQFEEKIR